MPVYLTEAVVLRSQPLFESDKLITFFSPEHGLIRSLAKGARRTTSRFGGRLELLTWNQILLARGRSFDILSQCETIHPFYQLRDVPEKLRAAVYWVKLIEAVAQEKTGDASLFRMVVDALAQLETAPAVPPLVRAFEVNLLRLEGLAPQLHACVHCQQAAAGLSHFSFSLGGGLCRTCLRHDPQAIDFVIGDQQYWDPDVWQTNIFSAAQYDRGTFLVRHFLKTHLGVSLDRWMV